MKAATAKQIRDELKDRTETELREIVLRLSRFKKENKELLSYLLFEAHHEEDYIQSIKSHIDEKLLEINTSNGYYAKKAIRRILKETKKFREKKSGKKPYSVSMTDRTKDRLTWLVTQEDSNISQVIKDLIDIRYENIK